MRARIYVHTRVCSWVREPVCVCACVCVYTYTVILLYSIHTCILHGHSICMHASVYVHVSAATAAAAAGVIQWQEDGCHIPTEDD